MMKFHRFWLVVTAAGCHLVNSNTTKYEYSLDPQPFMEVFGDERIMTTVPTMACDPSAPVDQCSALLPSSMLGASKLFCDTTTRMCAAAVDALLQYPVNVSMQNLPTGAVQFGIDSVTVEKIAYWLTMNRSNVAVPAVNLYVASAGAQSSADATAKLLGIIAQLRAMSPTCADSRDTAGDSLAPLMTSVCDVKLTDGGQSALASSVRDDKIPFQIMAHINVLAHGGDPVPTGTLAFTIHPTVVLSVLN